MSRIIYRLTDESVLPAWASWYAVDRHETDGMVWLFWVWFRFKPRLSNLGTWVEGKHAGGDGMARSGTIPPYYTRRMKLPKDFQVRDSLVMVEGKR